MRYFDSEEMQMRMNAFLAGTYKAPPRPPPAEIDEFCLMVDSRGRAKFRLDCRKSLKVPNKKEASDG